MNIYQTDTDTLTETEVDLDVLLKEVEVRKLVVHNDDVNTFDFVIES